MTGPSFLRQIALDPAESRPAAQRSVQLTAKPWQRAPHPGDREIDLAFVRHASAGQGVRDSARREGRTGIPDGIQDRGVNIPASMTGAASGAFSVSNSRTAAAAVV